MWNIWGREEVGKREGMRSLGRHRHRWKKILKQIFKKYDGGSGHGLHPPNSGQGRVVSSCEHDNNYNFYNQQTHTLYFVGHFIGLPTCFDPYGSSSGHLIH
jgi:hypothetical protein